ncbi:MAG: site-2 protease family protein [Candidatus Melainabacteria bacterium]|nr:site-2 protease family protein [Candidatus Melainabacteria bacterium]
MIELALKDFWLYLGWVMIMVGSICLHELFHALAAWSQGDRTAKEQGYFTLNPLVHMGVTSLVFLMLFGIAWGACPVNSARLRHGGWSEAWVSFAGPLANAILMLAFAAGFHLLPAAASLQSFCALAAMLNAGLLLFNLIPIPPLDGAGVVSGLLPASRKFYAAIEPVGMLLVMLLLWFNVGGFSLWEAARTLSGQTILLLQAVAGG